jgi:hypothetical protein
MKHVILYGPPAVGKLSVARRLAALTGFGLVENHVVNQAVAQALPFGHPLMTDLVIRLRGELIEAAAKARVEGLISTLVYVRNGTDDKVLRQWRQAVARHKGETCFVRLHCSQGTLLKRAAKAKAGKKRPDASQLKGFLKRFDLFTPVAGVASLEIDTEAQPAAAAAKLISQHFRLAKKGR